MIILGWFCILYFIVSVVVLRVFGGFFNFNIGLVLVCIGEVVRKDG